MYYAANLDAPESYSQAKRKGSQNRITIIIGMKAIEPTNLPLFKHIPQSL